MFSWQFFLTLRVFFVLSIKYIAVCVSSSYFVLRAVRFMLFALHCTSITLYFVLITLYSLITYDLIRCTFYSSKTEMSLRAQSRTLEHASLRLRSATHKTKCQFEWILYCSRAEVKNLYREPLRVPNLFSIQIPRSS